MWIHRIENAKTELKHHSIHTLMQMTSLLPGPVNSPYSMVSMAVAKHAECWNANMELVLAANTHRRTTLHHAKGSKWEQSDLQLQLIRSHWQQRSSQSSWQYNIDVKYMLKNAHIFLEIYMDTSFQYSFLCSNRCDYVVKVLAVEYYCSILYGCIVRIWTEGCSLNLLIFSELEKVNMVESWEASWLIG